MTDTLDMERQDLDCRNIDGEDVGGQHQEQQAAAGCCEDCCDMCEEEVSDSMEYEPEHDGGCAFPDGRDFLAEEDGIGVVEILLILVVLITLVIIFRERLTELLSTIFDSINSKSATVMQ